MLQQSSGIRCTTAGLFGSKKLGKEGAIDCHKCLKQVVEDKVPESDSFECVVGESHAGKLRGAVHCGLKDNDVQQHEKKIGLVWRAFWSTYSSI